jgi:hypothetical protein
MFIHCSPSIILLYFFPKFLIILQNTVSNGPGGRGSSNGRQKPRPNSSRDTRPKLLLTLKYNRSTSVLSVVIHKAVNLQVGSLYTKLFTYLVPSPHSGTKVTDTVHQAPTHSQVQPLHFCPVGRHPQSGQPTGRRPVSPGSYLLSKTTT